MYTCLRLHHKNFYIYSWLANLTTFSLRQKSTSAFRILAHGFSGTVFYLWRSFHYLEYESNVVLEYLYPTVAWTSFWLGNVLSINALFNLSDSIEYCIDKRWRELHKWKLNHLSNLAQFKMMWLLDQVDCTIDSKSKSKMKISLTISRRHVRRRNYLKLIVSSRFETIECIWIVHQWEINQMFN